MAPPKEPSPNVVLIADLSLRLAKILFIILIIWRVLDCFSAISVAFTSRQNCHCQCSRHQYTSVQINGSDTFTDNFNVSTPALNGTKEIESVNAAVAEVLQVLVDVKEVLAELRSDSDTFQKLLSKLVLFGLKKATSEAALIFYVFLLLLWCIIAFVRSHWSNAGSVQPGLPTIHGQTAASS